MCECMTGLMDDIHVSLCHTHHINNYELTIPSSAIIDPNFRKRVLKSNFPPCGHDVSLLFMYCSIL